MVVAEGNSDGSVGPLHYLITVWWDKKASLYHYFVCFKDQGSSCEVRGTAHWEVNNFVNDYEEIDHGTKTKWRDSFIDITPTSFTLVAAMQQPNGRMKTLITTQNKRR